MISIIDYGAGNIFSVKNALDYIGIASKLTRDPSDIKASEAIILPGVGAFPAAMKLMRESGLTELLIKQVREEKKPFLGICLGMQLLFEKGFEFEECEGLGLIPGYVDKIVEPGLIIPHMGWNKLEQLNSSPLLCGMGNDIYVYFVHSYKAFCCDDNIAAYCEYGGRIPALVQSDNVFGAQFHPEKSGETGLMLLRNFCKLI